MQRLEGDLREADVSFIAVRGPSIKQFDLVIIQFGGGSRRSITYAETVSTVIVKV